MLNLKLPCTVLEDSNNRQEEHIKSLTVLLKTLKEVLYLVQKDDENDEAEGAPQHIYSVDDLIINPAGTNGQRLLLLSVGFGVSTEESKKVLEENEIVIKDKILSAMSKKSLSLLSKVEMKDSLKVEIADKINSALPDAKIKNVYFSKYVLN